MIDVILVKYRAPRYENACIRSVLKHTKIPYNLIVHDNAPLNENLGVLWNKLIVRSDSEFICLLNTDTLVEADWLDKLLDVFVTHADAGAVGPVTNNAGGNGQEIPKTTQRNIVDYVQKHTLGTLCGFCLVFPKTVWQEVGGFPEDFGFYGQECAFLARVSKKGYKQYMRTDVFVWHEGGASAKLAEKRGELSVEEELKVGRNKRDASFEELRKCE